MDSLGKNGLPRRGHKQITVIIVQSLIILWLAMWAIGDYLNNIYVKAYVDATVAAYGWIALLAFVGGSLGSAWTMVHRRHAALGKSIEKSLKESKKSLPSPKISTPVLQAPAKSGLNPKLASIGIRTSSLSSISSTPGPSAAEPSTPASSPAMSFTGSPSPSDSGSKPAVELHPAVAALKAELSERRVTLGLVSATVGQDQGSPSPPMSSQAQSVERSGPPVQDSRPLQRVEPVNNMPAPPVVRQVPGPGPMRPMQSSPPARPTQPFSFNRPAQPQLPAQNNARPFLPSRPIQPGSQDRFEDAISRAGFSNPQPQNPNPVPQDRPVQTQIPRNVSTVITGIMPKKKDPQDQDNRNTSGQNSSS